MFSALGSVTATARTLPPLATDCTAPTLPISVRSIFPLLSAVSMSVKTGKYLYSMFTPSGWTSRAHSVERKPKLRGTPTVTVDRLGAAAARGRRRRAAVVVVGAAARREPEGEQQGGEEQEPAHHAATRSRAAASGAGSIHSRTSNARLDEAVAQQEGLLVLERGDELLVEARLQVRVDRVRVAGLDEVLGDADLVGDDPARLDRVVRRPARRAQARGHVAGRRGPGRSSSSAPLTVSAAGVMLLIFSARSSCAAMSNTTWTSSSASRSGPRPPAT